MRIAPSDLQNAHPAISGDAECSMLQSVSCESTFRMLQVTNFWSQEVRKPTQNRICNFIRHELRLLCTGFSSQTKIAELGEMRLSLSVFAFR